MKTKQNPRPEARAPKTESRTLPPQWPRITPIVPGFAVGRFPRSKSRKRALPILFLSLALTALTGCDWNSLGIGDFPPKHPNNQPGR